MCNRQYLKWHLLQKAIEYRKTKIRMSTNGRQQISKNLNYQNLYSEVHIFWSFVIIESNSLPTLKVYSFLLISTQRWNNVISMSLVQCHLITYVLQTYKHITMQKLQSP